MALNLNYTSEIMYDVRSVLFNIKERGGAVPGSFLNAELNRLQGSRAADVLNIAMVAIGKKECTQGQATPAQMEVLVARAQKESADLVSEIAQLRAAKGK